MDIRNYAARYLEGKGIDIVTAIEVSLLLKHYDYSHKKAALELILDEFIALLESYEGDTDKAIEVFESKLIK